MSSGRFGLAVAFVAGWSLLTIDSAGAETLAEALASAYTNNPTLNSQRAALRATDESVPQALSGYRPSVSATASASATSSSSLGSVTPGSVSLSVEQPVFLGHRTTNGVKAAESGVLAAREGLRSTEQSTLLAAAQAFMNLVQAQATLNLNRENVDFLQQQGKAAKDRLDVGEGTRTEVSQTDASLAAGRASYNLAVAALNTAVATYEQVIGHRPTTLGAAKPVDGLLPKSLSSALAEAMEIHPAILAAGYKVDSGEFGVKINEGALLPSVVVTGSVSHGEGSTGPGTVSNSASAVATLSVPLYQGGDAASKVRQSKEQLGQYRIDLDVARDTVRQAIISAWGSLDAARAQITAANALVTAQQLVLSGESEQRKVGQATTLDVLNAQQTLLNARVSLVTAQRDRVIASYALLAAIGKLDAQTLGLDVQIYDPTDHYSHVRDKWGGLRTPDGR